MNLYHKISSRTRPLVSFALLFCVALTLYSGSFDNAWTFDDFPVIVNNPDITSFNAFLDDSYPGRPLRELSYLLDHTLFGLEPAGWHLQSIFWHAFNAALLLALVRRLGGQPFVAWGAALLFIAHPIQVEVVANLSHRKDALALAFILLALLAYQQFFARRRWHWLFAALSLMAIALTAKQNALVLPLLFVACELCFIPRQQRLLVRHPRIFLSVALTACMVAAIWFLSPGIDPLREEMLRILHLRANFDSSTPLNDYYRMVFHSWSFMGEKFVWPLALAPEYTYSVPSSWFNIRVLTGIGVAVLLPWLSWRLNPLPRFAILWIIVLWLPTSNLWPLSYFAADRYLYAPSVGACILAAWSIDYFFISRSQLRNGVLILLVGALAVLTWQQNKVWRTPESLWSHAVKVSPTSTFALNNLGWTLLQRGQTEEAEQFLLRSIDNPYNPQPLANLGHLYEERDDRQLALSYYRRYLHATTDKPSYAERAQSLREHLKQQYRQRF